MEAANISQDYDSVVITHGGCADGIAAAHMFELFRSEKLGYTKLYYSYNRDFAKNRDMPDLKGKKVFITDYSFPLDVLRAIAREASELYIWDHHETAFNDLFTPVQDNRSVMINVKFSIVCSETSNYVPNEALVLSKHHNNLVNGFKVLGSRYDISTVGDEFVITSTGERIVNVCKVSIVFDMNLCGTEVTLGQLFEMHSGADTKDPPIVKNSSIAKDTIRTGVHPWYVVHIRDRDLWLWDKPGYIAGQHYNENSKAFGEAFFELRIHNDTLRTFDTYSREEIEKLYARGRELMEHNARFVKMVVSKAERVLFESYPALIATSPVLQSEIGNTIVKTADQPVVTLATLSQNTNEFVPVIGIVLRYNLADNCWNVSLRGRPGSPNVATLAKKYGGGGHPMAAGFDYVGDISTIFKYVAPDIKK